MTSGTFWYLLVPLLSTGRGSGPFPVAPAKPGGDSRSLPRWALDDLRRCDCGRPPLPVGPFHQPASPSLSQETTPARAEELKGRERMRQPSNGRPKTNQPPIVDEKRFSLFLPASSPFRPALPSPSFSTWTPSVTNPPTEMPVPRSMGSAPVYSQPGRVALNHSAGSRGQGSDLSES